jgi:LDH2 family malate/lactate/ureidoglycolate dehydrogenase
MMRIRSIDEVEKVSLAALRSCGAPEDHARTQVDLLIEAELRGVSSHGLLRLPRLVARIKNGVLDPFVKGRLSWRGPALLHVDGENGLGPVVGRHALDALIPRVREIGAAVASIANNNHLGMLAWYAEYAARNGLLCLALTTSEALVHPWGGRRAMIGTNPIAIGVPTSTNPFVMDTATGVVSMGKIHDYAQKGLALEPGWALDANGDPTTDALAATSGAIAPFGGAKGYALGLAFELLVTSLTGAAIGRAVRGTLDADCICTKGDVFILATPLGLGVERELTEYLDELRGEQPAVGFESVRIPGDRSTRQREERLQRGVPVSNEVWSELSALAWNTREGN